MGGLQLKRIKNKYESCFFSGLASRILQVGPVGSQFLGPVLIEVPHIASLRHGERETSILRCESASRGRWVEHPQEDFMEKLLKVRRKTISEKKHKC